MIDWLSLGNLHFPYGTENSTQILHNHLSLNAYFIEFMNFQNAL